MIHCACGTAIKKAEQTQCYWCRKGKRKYKKRDPKRGWRLTGDPDIDWQPDGKGIMRAVSVYDPDPDRGFTREEVA